MEAIIDKTEAIEKAGGKSSLAKELFAMLLNELPGLKQAMNEAYQAEQRDAFWDHAHKIHGSTAYCGVPNLRHHSRKLELEIKSDNSFADMQTALQDLNSAIDALLEIGKSELESDWE